MTGVAAVHTARRLGPGHRVVTILCDSGLKHLSKFWAQVGEVGGDVGSDDLYDMLGWSSKFGTGVV